jgi:hypothetical protein
LAIAWPAHTASTLGDLVQHMEGIPDEDKTRVWDLIDAWAARETDEKSKAALCETIRRFAFTRRGHRRGLSSATADRARRASAALAPQDPVIRNAWLFAKDWIEESADEMVDEGLDLAKRDERIDAARRSAIAEIWGGKGFDGIRALLADSKAPFTVGRYAGAVMPDIAAAVRFTLSCLALDADPQNKPDRCLEGFLAALDQPVRAAVLDTVLKKVDDDIAARLLRCAPFKQETWALADAKGPAVANLYWGAVSPWWRGHTDEDRLELIDRLLLARRPRAAFFAVHNDWDKVETTRLRRLLQEVATVGDEGADRYRLDAHDLSDALSSLGGRPGVSEAEMAHLEFLYVSALDHTEHGIPNLERQICQSPSLFAQAVALTYKRNDDGEDPPALRIDDRERRAKVASATHRLLDRVRRTPGTQQDGSVDRDELLAWLNETRRLCAEYARPEIGDQCIGQLLARSSPGSDGSWPSTAVCDGLEAIASPEIGIGFRVGVYNSRGAVWRGEGGGQERGLATQYRTRAAELAIEYPYVSGVLEDVARSYDRDAHWHDNESALRHRLGY